MPSNQTLLTTAARNQCHILTALRAATTDKLREEFERLVTANSQLVELEQLVNGLLGLPDPQSRKDALAELLYFRQGHLNLVNRNFNSLTRLQMEHEALACGLFAIDQLPGLATWDLRLKLALKVHRPAFMPYLFETASPTRDSGYHSPRSGKDESPGSPESSLHASCCPTSSTSVQGSERGDDEDDDDDEKACYVTKRHPKTGEWRTFRY